MHRQWLAVFGDPASRVLSLQAASAKMTKKNAETDFKI